MEKTAGLKEDTIEVSDGPLSPTTFDAILYIGGVGVGSVGLGVGLGWMLGNRMGRSSKDAMPIPSESRACSPILFHAQHTCVNPR